MKALMAVCFLANKFSRKKLRIHSGSKECSLAVQQWSSTGFNWMLSINIPAVFRNGIEWAFHCKNDFSLRCLREDEWEICKRLTLSKVRWRWRKNCCKSHFHTFLANFENNKHLLIIKRLVTQKENSSESCFNFNKTFVEAAKKFRKFWLK